MCVCVNFVSFAAISTKICILDKEGAKPEKPSPSQLFSVLHQHLHRYKYKRKIKLKDEVGMAG